MQITKIFLDSLINVIKEKDLKSDTKYGLCHTLRMHKVCTGTDYDKLVNLITSSACVDIYKAHLWMKEARVNQVINAQRIRRLLNDAGMVTYLNGTRNYRERATSIKAYSGGRYGYKIRDNYAGYPDLIKIEYIGHYRDADGLLKIAKILEETGIEYTIIGNNSFIEVYKRVCSMCYHFNQTRLFDGKYICLVCVGKDKHLQWEKGER
jgi:hypothetical protein